MIRLNRFSVIHFTLVLFALALLGQAARVQLLEGKEWAERARRQQFRVGSVAAPRGRILDASGNVLAETRELYRLNVAPSEIKDLALVQSLLRERGFAQQSIDGATDRSRKWVTLPGLFPAAEIVRLTSVAGLHPQPVVKREYASAEGIRRIVGSVDREGRGTSGIELSLDSALRGDSTRSSFARDVRGRRLDSPEARAAAPRSGNNVMLTINRDLQEICERALARATDSLDATGGDIVVLNPVTGEILAMASLRRVQKSFANTAVTEPFEPGSTLKPFVAAALLDRGRAHPGETVETFNGLMKLGARTITDDRKAESMTLSEVIRYSSNIGIVQFASRLSPKEMFETLRDLGIGTPTGIPIPGEADGTLREPSKWRSTSRASVVMGYEVSVTPLQLAAAYSAFANGGYLMQPHIVKEIRGPGGDLIYQAVPRRLRRVFAETIAMDVRRLLRSVVDSGTAVKADLATFKLAGKSGTARRTLGGRYVEGNYTASFVGLFPAEKPQYVVLVKLDSPRRGYLGGEIAAPVTSVVLRAALAAGDAALDREGLASVEREVPLTDTAAASRATLPVRAVGSLARSIDIMGPETFGTDYAERTPLPAKLVMLPFVANPKQVDDASPRAVPETAGLTVRSAVRALHDAGFRVRLMNSRGPSTLPAPGTLLAPGSIVKLHRNR